MSLTKSEKNSLIRKLKKFGKKLDVYRETADHLSPADYIFPPRITLGHEWRNFEKIRNDLQKEYGELKTTIEKHGGSPLISLSGVQDDVFILALINKRPNSLTRSALEKAIMLVNIAIGNVSAEPGSEQLATEAIYANGKPYDAYKHIKEMISEARRKLIIVDPYVDSTLFILLETAQSAVEIKILTSSMKGDFEHVGRKFMEQREQSQQGTVEVRKSDKFHDRFIIVDNNVLHIGASLKDAGKRLFAMNEIEGQDSKSMLMKKILEYWDEAEVVI